MSAVFLNPGDSFEVALKQFNRKVLNAGILSEARRRKRYESPQARRRRKATAAHRRRKHRPHM
ncbi:MAG: 30S ribosomal protein S21 [Ktedonobacteraceae bacterium]|nr:30S ribosomal protein S21 [Ktedonobacteraceae bacterium]